MKTWKVIEMEKKQLEEERQKLEDEKVRYVSDAYLEIIINYQKVHIRKLSQRDYIGTSS